jgi:toxin YoeB
VHRIVYTKQAAKDIKNLKAAGLSTKAKDLIEIIRNDPFKNPPPYEALVGNLDGFYSKRINIKHRLVYQVYGDKVEINDMEFEGTVKIVRMWTHYEGMI